MIERMDDLPEPDLPISKTFFFLLRASMLAVWEELAPVSITTGCLCTVLEERATSSSRFASFASQLLVSFPAPRPLSRVSRHAYSGTIIETHHRLPVAVVGSDDVGHVFLLEFKYVSVYKPYVLPRNPHHKNRHTSFILPIAPFDMTLRP